MRDLKIGNQANGNGKKMGGGKDGYKKKYDRKLGRHTCVKIEEKRNPRKDGVRKKETHAERRKREMEERRERMNNMYP